MNKQICCGFLGLGLIGGSVAKALKERNPSIKIKVFDTDKNTLYMALAEKTADEIFTSLNRQFCQCDYLFLCAPVSVNLQNLEKIAPILPSHCLISDVGSVKEPIHKKVRELGLQAQFIGGHPMAGSERFGFLNSNAALLENAYYVLTPEPEVSPTQINSFYELIKSTGALPYVLDVKRHDQATAAISHLPHLIASSLVNLVKEGDDEHATFKTLAAGGFKDITRIASSSPSLWQQICMENQENILEFLTLYIQRLTELKEQLFTANTDFLYNFFANARDYRDSFMTTRSGPLMKQYVLTLDIPDKTGALAQVVALLASHSISIKNIGIVHNREYQEGVLRMEFYHPTEYEKALVILHQEGYSVHQQ